MLPFVWLTHRLAQMQSRNEVLSMTFMFIQEINLTVFIKLLWPEVLVRLLSLIATFVNVSIVATAPECQGDGCRGGTVGDASHDARLDVRRIKYKV